MTSLSGRAEFELGPLVRQVFLLFNSLSVSSERRVPCQNPTWSCGERASRPNRILPESSDLFFDELGNRSTELSGSFLHATRRIEMDRSYHSSSSPTSPRYHRQSCFCYLLFSLQCISSLTEASHSFHGDIRRRDAATAASPRTA